MTDLKNRLTNELKSFEKQYSLESDDFYRRYESGEVGDSTDFVEWSATIEMLKNVRHRLVLSEPDNRQ